MHHALNKSGAAGRRPSSRGNGVGEARMSVHPHIPASAKGRAALLTAGGECMTGSNRFHSARMPQ